jgi:DNA-binding CsgD family transcriptional regulator
MARYDLTHRELEVAELVSKGLRNKEVAAKLFVSEKTVKFHLTHIYRKMGVNSRSQMIVKMAVIEDETLAREPAVAEI